jgi:hypothetical protein
MAHPLYIHTFIQVMVLQATVVVRQWQSSDHVVTPTEKNAKFALQQRNGVLYAVCADVFQLGSISCSIDEAHRRRRRKGNRVPGGITGSPCLGDSRI